MCTCGILGTPTGEGYFMFTFHNKYIVYVIGIQWLAIDNSTGFDFASLLVRGSQLLLGWLALKKNRKPAVQSLKIWRYFDRLRAKRPWQLCNCRDSICSCHQGAFPEAILADLLRYCFLYLRNAHVHTRMKQSFISIAALWAAAASVAWQQAVPLVLCQQLPASSAGPAGKSSINGGF